MTPGQLLRKLWRPRGRGQHTSLVLVSSWWTILFIYFVTSRAFLLREQPFVLDWLWWSLLMLPLLPAFYSWLFLRRISITDAFCHPFHAGNHGTLQFTLNNAGRLPVPAVNIAQPLPKDEGGEHSTFTHLGAKDRQQLKLPVMEHSRGTRKAPALRVQTKFPFSMFTTWKTFQTQGEYVVYPSPEPNAPHWPDALEQGSRKVRRGEDVVGFRPHRYDDPLNIVDWKATAKLGHMVAREYHDQDCVLFFSWEEVSQLDTEHAISRLTAWILMADAQGRSYCLDLHEGPFVDVGSGEAHKHACLGALADYKKATA
jgi:uncharacterized protein (DUF58 family)